MRDGKKKAKTVAVTPTAAPPAADDPGPSMPAAPPPTRQNTMAVMPAELPEVSRREAAVSIASHRATNSTFFRWRTQDPIVAAVIERQLAYMEAVEKAAMAASAERARAREVRQQAIFDAALRVPKRADDPFRGPLPEWVDRFPRIGAGGDANPNPNSDPDPDPMLTKLCLILTLILTLTLTNPNPVWAHSRPHSRLQAPKRRPKVRT